MAVYRETPKCPHCGKIIAKGIYRKLQPGHTFYGDTFMYWEYKKHKCKKALKLKVSKEMKEWFKKKLTWLT